MNLPKVTQDYLANGASNGNRNNALLDAACQFRDARYSIDQAIKELVPRATADGLDRSSVLKTIQSAFSRAPRDACAPSHDAVKPNNGSSQEVPTYRKITFLPKSLPPPLANSAITFLETFKQGEWVAIGNGYIHQDNQGKISKQISKGVVRTREAWIADIKQRGMDTVFPFLEGLFVRVNPMKSDEGSTDKDVAFFREILVEADEGEHEDQLGAIHSIGLPISSIVYSGDRSVQGRLVIDAPNEEIYRERFAIIRRYCVESLGLKMDEKNKNPSRYCRLPGAKRTRRDHETDEKILDSKGRPILDPQTLLAVNIHGKPWDEWVKGLPLEDGLPDIESPDQFLATRMTLDAFLIDGLLREKSKMNFTSQSKARKTWLQIHQALCIGSGKPWLGHACTKSPVLYVNLELKGSTLNNRVLDICEVMGVDPVRGHLVDFWNLRGKSADIAVMVSRILARMKERQYKMVYLDPAYKCLGWRDENKAGDIANFMNEVEKIAEEGGSSIGVTGHAPKGDVSSRNPNDLQSGSGVWSRDPDVVASFLDCKEDSITKIHGEDCITVQFSGMREDPTPLPFAAKWEYPMFIRVDGAVEKTGRPSKYSEGQMLDILGDDHMKRSHWYKKANEKLGIPKSSAYDLMKDLEISKKVFENSEGQMERSSTPKIVPFRDY
jgi:RecA-family ATPase